MFRKLKDCVVTDKNVFVRSDMNVPVVNGKITDDTRIKATIPTLEYLIKNEAKVILASHLGRPKGKVVPEMSLRVLLPKLQEFFPTTKIHFVDDCIGKKVRKVVENAKYGEIVLLENLRFHREEQKNDEKFSRELASLANLYVNDAFSCSHREHSSIVGLPKILKGCAGFCFEKEIDNLTKFVSNPEKPLMVIIGGSKISTKLSLLDALMEKVDYLVVGGGMANTLLYAKDYNIGKSLLEKDLKQEALNVVRKAENKNCEMVLPRDVVVCKELKEGTNFKTVKINEIKNDDIIADIGDLTVNDIIEKIKKCKTVIWNGPLGVYEIKPFDKNTNKLAKKIVELTEFKKILSIAGGGDIISALSSIGLKEKFTYYSTAGAAFLRWLEGGSLVGLDVIEL